MIFLVHLLAAVIGAFIGIITFDPIFRFTHRATLRQRDAMQVRMDAHDGARQAKRMLKRRGIM